MWRRVVWYINKGLEEHESWIWRQQVPHRLHSIIFHKKKLSRKWWL